MKTLSLKAGQKCAWLFFGAFRLVAHLCVQHLAVAEPCSNSCSADFDIRWAMLLSCLNESSVTHLDFFFFSLLFDLAFLFEFSFASSFVRFLLLL